MPQKMRGIAFKSVIATFSLHEGVIAGIGVLLFFLGLWSGAILTKIFSFLIAGIAAYYVVDSYRSRNGKKEETSEPGIESAGRESVPLSPPVRDEAPSEFFEAVRPDDEEESPPPGDRIEEEEEKEVQFEEPAPQEHPAIVFTTADFVDDEVPNVGRGAEPKSEFNFVLQKILSVIHEVTFANSASFFWVNHDSEQLVLEGKVTESEAFAISRKIPLGLDIVSQIARSGRPEVVSHIAANAERDIVPYYTSLQDIRSFVGVPVFYPQHGGNRLPVGVLAIDSKADDAYGEETVVSLAKFTQMLSALLRSSTEKYDLLSESELLKAEKRFRAKAFDQSEVSEIGNALAEEVSPLLPWDAMTLTLFDDAQKQWAIANVRTRHNHRYVVAKQVLDFHASVVGKAIRTNSVQNVGDLSKTSEPRFLGNEASLGIARVGSFAAIPIASSSKCYGALAVECREKDVYGEKEIAAATCLTSIAGVALELHEANDIIREFVVVDERTGALSKKYLRQRLSEELQRADDNGADISFVLFGLSALSDITTRYGKAGADAAVTRVASILRSSIRPYDLIGRYDQSMFGIVLVNTTANDAYLWAEKLRSAIASTVVPVEQKTLSVTVTVGVCGATENMTADECISNALQVFERAKEAGGNIVRVY